MQKKINNAELAITCSENWSDMSVTTEGRFCQKCSKMVYDLTSKDTVYFNELILQNRNGFCARLAAPQMLTKTKHSHLKKIVQAVMFIAGFAGWAKNAEAQELNQCGVGEKTIVPDRDGAVLGKVKVRRPIYQEQLAKLHAYLAANCKFSSEDQGTVIANFSIDKTGEIMNANAGTLTEYFTASNSVLAEITRVLRFAPKWEGYIAIDPKKTHQDRLWLFIKNGIIGPYVKIN